MAEAREKHCLPPEGLVQEVRKQWCVHEDGVLAYRLQNEEIDHHYDFNRFNRRRVREDIPVAKTVQTQEEIEVQKERLRKLAALQAQSEADEIVARKINRKLQEESLRREVVREVEDEELARQLQEKEKKRYERYLEKKRERKLKKEREKLEQQLARTTEEARLVIATSTACLDNVQQNVETLGLQSSGTKSHGQTTNCLTRVTPSGHIEDDGDFSDFFAIPPDGLHPTEWEQLQQQQDEELARLLQEQEHKRTKAEVDRSKLREIELRDEQLAAIIQEQEKLKERKYKMKKQQLRERKKIDFQLSGQELLPLGASANMMSQLAENGVTENFHHRYRRNSYTKSIDNALVSTSAETIADSSPVLPTSHQDSEEIARVSEVQDKKHWKMLNTAHATSSLIPPHILSHGHAIHENLSHDDTPTPEVLTWLNAQVAPVEFPPSADDHLTPSPPGSYSGKELFSRNSADVISQPVNFNIAAMIDPTYQRRQHELEYLYHTLNKMHMTVSESLPHTDSSSHNLQLDRSFEDSTEARGLQPVQGQKRSTVDKRSRKLPKPIPEPKGTNCKQQ